jgi:glutamate racemase
LNAPEESPIGIFDSGVGGLTVVQAIHARVPHEHIVYFGDTARVPYGSKSKETITRYALENADFLVKQNIKLLIVACNTASACAIEALQKYNMPIVDVIKPGVRAAAKQTRNGRIGIIGTRSTIHSNAYVEELKKYDRNVFCTSISCPLFVPLVEENMTEGLIPSLVASQYLAPLISKHIDTLILGCTHYPLMRKTISKIMGDQVRLVDSASETALEVEKTLESYGLLRRSITSSRISFYVSDDPIRFTQMGSIFLDVPIEHVEIVCD